ncbi:MAG: lytic transglycosylase domain-containing protein [Zoogloeaceae bacterium]|nr:lytic transglycosylase domain-containing protein [Zoogloeaceae bacterium]
MKWFRFPAIASLAVTLIVALAFPAARAQTSSAPSPAQPPTTQSSTIDTPETAGDESFLAAREAFRTGNRRQLEILQQELSASGHVLASYADYYLLRQGLEKQDEAAIQAFIAREGDSYLGERLAADWLKVLARRGNWEEAARLYARLQKPDQESRCVDIQGRLRQSVGSVNRVAAQAEAEKLWITLSEVPEGCHALFSHLGETLPDDLYWQRIRLLTERGKQPATRQALRVLPEGQQPEAKQFTLLWEKPLLWLARQKQAALPNRARQEVVALAIARLAANDPHLAIEQLERWQTLIGKEATAWCWGTIALQGARRHLPDALAWYGKSRPELLSPDAAEWRIRAALRAQNWKMVRASIENLPEEQKSDPAWIYWLARADKAQGRLNDARDRFWQLRGQPHFYGNLADEELRREIRIPPPAPPPSAAERAAARANPGLQRALALFRLDLRLEGIREWNWAVRDMDDRQLLAAANLALEHHIYDRAISTAERTREQHNYALRFLAPFDGQVRPAARERALDDAWVYGLMRQESRFITHAKSSAGASGLMQLMPATAKWVARKIGLKDYKHANVNDPDINLLLGTHYMRMVLESLSNHPVLASAAYNAGPGRARRWCADIPLEGAIYAETIPFNETRDYVKKVMSNSVYYTILFTGRSVSLYERLNTIPAKGDASAVAELP